MQHPPRLSHVPRPLPWGGSHCCCLPVASPTPPPLPPPGCICFSSARNVLLLPPKATRPSLKPCPTHLCAVLAVIPWGPRTLSPTLLRVLGRILPKNVHLHKSSSTGQNRCPGLSALWLNGPSDSCLIIQSHGAYCHCHWDKYHSEHGKWCKIGFTWGPIPPQCDMTNLTSALS